MASVPSIPSISREYLHVPSVSGADNTMAAEMAIIPATTEEPAESDWHAATWDGTGVKLLIGPAPGLPLANGTYAVWLRITAAPEKPVIRTGLIRIT